MRKLLSLVVFMLCSAILLSDDSNVREIQVKLYDDFGSIDSSLTKTLCSIANDQNIFEIVIGVSQQVPVGHYLLTIQKDGYEDISEQIIIGLGDDIFTIERYLVTLLREVRFGVGHDLHDCVPYIYPDVLTLNGEPLIDGNKIKPGEYELVIEKDGYQKIHKKILIAPSSKTYRFFESMRSQGRLIYFKVTSDYKPEEEIVPDEIIVNNHFVKVTNGYIHPDTSRFIIKKQGYKTISERVDIRPSSKPFFLEWQLQALPRSVQTDIRASFPNIRISPDVCSLNGINIKDQETFKPGRYQLHVERSGYVSINKEIEIPPSEMPFIISETVEPENVAIKIQISYDILPENAKSRYICEIISEIGTVEIKDGEKIKPDSYLCEISQPGYHIVHDRILMMPGEKEHLLQYKLIAKDRNVRLNIANQHGYRIQLDKVTLDGKKIPEKIKPGTYELIVMKKGYAMICKQIEILGSDVDYVISETIIPESP